MLLHTIKLLLLTVFSIVFYTPKPRVCTFELAGIEWSIGVHRWSIVVYIGFRVQPPFPFPVQCSRSWSTDNSTQDHIDDDFDDTDSFLGGRL